MKKLEYIDLCEEELGEAFYDKVDKSVIEAQLNKAYNQIVFDIVKSGGRNFDLCRKRFTSIAVTWDSAAGVYYSSYPKPIVPNINIEMIVGTIQGNGYRFYPTTESNVMITESLLCNSLNLKIRTLLKRERIEYINMESLSDDDIEGGATPTPKVPTVRMDLAIQFKGFENTDEIYMPMGRDYEVCQLAADTIRKEPIIEVRNE